MRWAELSGMYSLIWIRRLDSVVLLGHSLGGKVAMRLACDCPERVRQLVIADIAAKVYPPYHDAEFRAMRRIDLKEGGKSARGGTLLEPL